MWLAVDHNTSVTSGKWVWWVNRIAQVSKLGSYQLNLCHSWGYEGLQKSKDSLKACFKNANIYNIYIQHFYGLTKWMRFFIPFLPSISSSRTTSPPSLGSTALTGFLKQGQQPQQRSYSLLKASLSLLSSLSSLAFLRESLAKAFNRRARNRFNTWNKQQGYL